MVVAVADRLLCPPSTRLKENKRTSFFLPPMLCAHLVE